MKCGKWQVHNCCPCVLQGESCEPEVGGFLGFGEGTTAVPPEDAAQTSFDTGTKRESDAVLCAAQCCRDLDLPSPALLYMTKKLAPPEKFSDFT